MSIRAFSSWARRGAFRPGSSRLTTPTVLPISSPSERANGRPDITAAGTTEALESIAVQMGSYNSPSRPQPVETYLYGYVLPTNPNKTVKDLCTPNNTNIKILAIDVVTNGTVIAQANQPPQVNLGNGSNAYPPDNTPCAGRSILGPAITAVPASTDLATRIRSMPWRLPTAQRRSSPGTQNTSTWALAASTARCRGRGPDDSPAPGHFHQYSTAGCGDRRLVSDRHVHGKLCRRRIGHVHSELQRLDEGIHRNGRNDGAG